MELTKSDTIAKFAAAFVKAQAEIKGALKDAKNGHFDSEYADLTAIDAACRPALNKHGIAVIQSPGKAENGKLALTTLLLHESGECISGTGEIGLGRGDGPQAYGSALTYARRYHLAAMAGVCPTDDDGEGAEGRDKKTTQEQPRAKEETVIKLVELLESVTMPEGWGAKALKKKGVKKWSELTEEEVTGAINYVKAQAGKAKA